MSLLQEIQKDQLDARKKNQTVKKSILTTLLGEIQTQSSRPKGMDTVSLIKKFIKDINDTIKHGGLTDKLQEEIEVLSAHLPTQLTELEIQNIIYDSGSSTLGEAMKHMKMNHQGNYDGGLASQVAKRIFA